MKVYAIIPARFDSTRFPGKPLALINGQPMYLWVYQAALTCHQVDTVILATDDERIRTNAISYGCNVVMTGCCPSGTDRVHEVAKTHGLDSTDIIVNVQGDEPLIRSSHIETLIYHMKTNTRSRMVTLAIPISYDMALSPNVVKVVRDHCNRALYFSRCPIPYHASHYLKHIGIYAYRMATLSLLCALPQTDIEKAEQLEQLRALDNGIGIDVLTTLQDTISVDTPADLANVINWLNSHT